MESFQGQGQVQILEYSVFSGHMAWFPGWFQDNSESWYLSSTFEPWFFPEDGKWKSRSMNMIPVAQSFSYQPTFVFRDGLFSWCSFIFSNYSCTRSPLQATLHNKLTDIYVTFAFSPSKLGQVLDILPQQKSHESCLKMTGIHDILIIYLFSWTMPVGMWDLSSSSRDWNHALCIGIMESQSLDGQGSPWPYTFEKPTNDVCHGWFSSTSRKYCFPWKDAQHHSLLEKCKSKLQWGITSHLQKGHHQKIHKQ